MGPPFFSKEVNTPSKVFEALHIANSKWTSLYVNRNGNPIPNRETDHFLGGEVNHRPFPVLS